MKYILQPSLKTIDSHITISGAKNSILPLAIATLLIRGRIVFKNVPFLTDLYSVCEMLCMLGLKVEPRPFENILIIENNGVRYQDIPRKLTKKTRYSSMLLGILSSLFNEAKIGFPGGCNYGGDRLLDIHLSGLKSMGVQAYVEDDFFILKKQPSPELNSVKFRYPSVGATMNLILHSVLGNREVILENIAHEPEVHDLIGFLCNCGANINFISQASLLIKGVDILKGEEWEIIPDRIETLTYIALSVILKNVSILENTCITFIEKPLEVLSSMGIIYEYNDKKKTISIYGNTHKELKPIEVNTEPYPGIPTDFHPILTVLCLKASGISKIKDTVSPKRYSYINEIIKTGAKIEVDETTGLTIHGLTRKLKGSEMTCTDLRGGMACLLTALLAEGKSIINNVGELQRGYYELPKKLLSLGVNISTV